MAQIPGQQTLTVTVAIDVDGRTRAALTALGWTPPEGVTFEPVNGLSRKLGRDWSRIGPALEGRLLSFGGTDDDAWAWIAVRGENGAEGEVA